MSPPNLAAALEIRGVPGFPLVSAGDDLSEVVAAALKGSGERLQDGDVLVVAQKVISKVEGRHVDLADIRPRPEARELAARAHKDARLVELILQESVAVLGVRPGLIVVEHRLGLVLANAGIDYSNVDGESTVLLLPDDPDRSSRELRGAIRRRLGTDIAVIINDSLGRAWRLGTIGTAIGVSGLAPLLDLRGRQDLFGRTMKAAVVGLGDSIAAAASVVQGECDEGIPIALVRGLSGQGGEGCAADLLRPREEDLFR